MSNYNFQHSRANSTTCSINEVTRAMSYDTIISETDENRARGSISSYSIDMAGSTVDSLMFEEYRMGSGLGHSTFEFAKVVNVEIWDCGVLDPEQLYEYIRSNSVIEDEDEEISSDMPQETSLKDEMPCSKEELVYGNLQTSGSLSYGQVVLSVEQLRQCKEPWSMSQVFQWALKLPVWFEKALFYENEFSQCLLLLIKFYFPYMDEARAMGVVELYIKEFRQAGCVIEAFDNQVFINEEAAISGVVPCLTVCYSTHLNHGPNAGPHHCYVSDCNFAENRPATAAGGLGQQWYQYWGFSREELAQMAESTREKNSAIFELISSTSRRVETHREFVRRVGGDFLQQPDSVLFPVPKDDFYRWAFAPVARMAELKSQCLLEPLTTLLRTQGRFISRDYWQPFAEWLARAREVYGDVVESHCRMEMYVNFARVKPDSDFFAWYRRQDSYNAQKHFGNAFVDDAVVLLPTFERIYKHAEGVEKQEVAKVMSLLRLFALFMDQWKARCDSAVHWERIRFKKGVSPVDFKDDVIICKNQVKCRAFDKFRTFDKFHGSELRYLILFQSGLLICEVDLANDQYLVVEQPIPAQYLHIVPCDMARVLFMSRPKSVRDIHIYSVAHDNVVAVQVFAGQDTEWAAKADAARAAALATLLPVYSMEYLAKNVTSYEHVSPNRAIGRHSDISRLVQGRKLAALCTLSSAISSAVSVRYDNRDYTVVGLNTGVCVRLDAKHLLWEKILAYDNVSRVRYLAGLETLVMLAARNLLCLPFHDILGWLARKAASKQTMPKLRPTLVAKNVVDFSVVCHNGSDRLVYVRKTGAVSSVHVAQLTLNNGHYGKPTLTRLNAGDRAIDMENRFAGDRAIDVEKCFAAGPHIFLLTSKQFFLYTFDKKESRVTPFPQLVHVVDSSADRQTSLSNDLVRSAQMLQSSTPVGVFQLGSGETLVVLSRLAVFCKENGYFSRAQFIEFDIVCLEAAFRNGHLIAAGKNSIEIYKIFAQGPNAGQLAQIITGQNIRLVDFTDRTSLVKFVSSHASALSQAFVELVQR